MQLSRKLLLQPQLRFNERLITTAGSYDMQLPAGTYFFEMCGGGGQGGTAGGVGNGGGGAGGAGGYGQYTACVFKVTKPGSCTLLVGEGGNPNSPANIRGGAGGPTPGANAGGAGGNAGGYTLLTINNGVNNGTSFIARYIAWINTDNEIVYTNMTNDLRALCYVGGTSTFYASIPENEATPVTTYVGTTVTRWQTVALPQGNFTRYPSGDVFVAGLYAGASGGGGGGGGGGYAPNGRSPKGSGGGGGGGYNGITISSDFLSWTRNAKGGQSGGGGGEVYTSGGNGGNGNPAFPSLYGGNGGRGSGANGGTGGTGGGASGAGGAGGANNEDPRYNTAGGGGGGAGGDLSARGGFHGNSGWTPATDGSNAATWPLSVYDNAGNIIAGANNSTPTFGMGGAGDMNVTGGSGTKGVSGSDGWAQTKKIS